MKSIYCLIVLLTATIGCSKPEARVESVLNSFPNAESVRTVKGTLFENRTEQIEFDLKSENIETFLDILLASRKAKPVKNALKWEGHARIHVADQTDAEWSIHIFIPDPSNQMVFKIYSPNGSEYYSHETLTYRQFLEKVKPLTSGR